MSHPAESQQGDPNPRKATSVNLHKAEVLAYRGEVAKHPEGGTCKALFEGLWRPIWEFPKIADPYFGVLIIGILPFRVLS